MFVSLFIDINIHSKYNIFMFRKYVHKHISWYDFKSTNLKEFVDVSLPHTIPEDLLKRLLSPSKRSAFIEHGNLTYISLSLPTSNEHSSIDIINIKMIFSSQFLITSRRDSIPGFRSAKKRLAGSSEIQGTTTELITILFEEIFETIEQTIRNQRHLLNRTRREILNSQYISKQYVHGLNSSVLKIYDVLDAQADVYHSLRKEEEIPTHELTHILRDFDALLFAARSNVEHIIDQKLLFKQAITRQKKLRSLKTMTFFVVGIALLFVAVSVF